ncbi:hypothetical protein [Alcanivorax sp. 24]|uniref:hypothetical protein n=1 Tax=Alcanivorax sp. 24 TaxID=2545266 RepID=UPI0010608C02|nr:hypothetical protein [Alcanivorax sp. 24]
MNGFKHKMESDAAAPVRLILQVLLLWLWPAVPWATEIGPPGVYLDFAGDRQDRYQGRLTAPEFTEPVYFLLSDWVAAEINVGGVEDRVAARLSREMGDIWGGPGSYDLATGPEPKEGAWFAGVLAPGRYALWVASPERKPVTYTVFMTAPSRRPPEIWSAELGCLSREPILVTEQLEAPVLTHRYLVRIDRQVLLEATLGVTGPMPALRILSADGRRILARAHDETDSVRTRVTPGRYQVEVSGERAAYYDLTLHATGLSERDD